MPEESARLHSATRYVEIKQAFMIVCPPKDLKEYKVAAALNAGTSPEEMNNESADKTP